MINALSAASLALLYSDQASHPSSRMRLQLLLYLAQGHMLRETKNPLFNEHIYAWDEGPVIPEVFGKYKNYGDILSASDGVSVAPGSVSQKDRETIRETVRMYVQWNDVGLEQLVLSTLPWINAHKDGPNGIIRKTAIGGYFSEHPEI